MLVLLSASDLEDARYYATMRQSVNSANGITNLKRARLDGIEAHYQGMCGELAFCKAFDLPVDRSLGPRSGGADTVLRGYRFDVKATMRPNGRLLAHRANPDIDVYALSLLHELPWVHLPGYALKAEFITPANLTDLGYGPTYAMEQERLRGFKVDCPDDWLTDYLRGEAKYWKGKRP